MGFRKIYLPPEFYKLRIEIKTGLWYTETEIYEKSDAGTLYISTKQKVPEYDENMRKMNEKARGGR